MARIAKSLLLLACLIVSAFSFSVGAQEEQRSSASQRWQSMPEEKRQALRQRYQQWKALPRARQKELKERFARWQAMPTDKRQRLLDNHRHFKQLPAQRQQNILKNIREFKQLPQELRQQRLQELQTRREEQRAGGRATNPSSETRRLPDKPARDKLKHQLEIKREQLKRPKPGSIKLPTDVTHPPIDWKREAEKLKELKQKNSL